jgi:hypothetical protein
MNKEITVNGSGTGCQIYQEAFRMIIENTGLRNMKSDLAHLDEVTEKLGFVRWQWENYRATYDLKIHDNVGDSEYYLRINARVETGKLENPYSILYLTDVYVGKTSFPHGLDYDIEVPQPVMNTVNEKVSQLKQQLAE